MVWRPGKTCVRLFSGQTHRWRCVQSIAVNSAWRICFPQHKDLKPLVIQFEVVGRELVALKADFELPDANDPQRLVFSGQISFNGRADSSAVSDAVALRLGDQRLALYWRVLSDGKTHDFTSAVITRTREAQELALHIDRADLELSQDYDNTWSLPPLSASFRCQDRKIHGPGPSARKHRFFQMISILVRISRG